MTKAKAWFFFLPGNVYAYGPVKFREPIPERDFRAWVREWLSVAGQKVKRLPAGSQVWPAK